MGQIGWQDEREQPLLTVDAHAQKGPGNLAFSCGCVEHLCDGDATVTANQCAWRLLAAMARIAFDANSEERLIAHQHGGACVDLDRGTIRANNPSVTLMSRRRRRDQQIAVIHPLWPAFQSRA